MAWSTWSRLGVFAAVACSAAVAAGQSCDCQSGSCCEPSRFARPSDTGRYIGYYVGGGSACRGEERLSHEGVWGWDYSGFHFVPRIDLLWNHGRRYQGGPGAYKTDGPRFLEEHKEKKGE
jgi:hypothetical protein